MLLKFTTADMLNTTLIDVSTGDRAYDIITILQPSLDTNPITQSHSVSDSDSDSDSHPNEKAPSSSLSSPPELRRTWIRDADGKVLLDISWSGRQPNITIGEEKIGGLTDLFGSSTVRFMSVPTTSLHVLDHLVLNFSSGPKSSQSLLASTQNTFGQLPPNP